MNVTKKGRNKGFSPFQIVTTNLRVLFSGVGKGLNLYGRKRGPVAQTFCRVKQCVERVYDNIEKESFKVS